MLPTLDPQEGPTEPPAPADPFAAHRAQFGDTRPQGGPVLPAPTVPPAPQAAPPGPGPGSATFTAPRPVDVRAGPPAKPPSGLMKQPGGPVRPEPAPNMGKAPEHTGVAATAWNTFKANLLPFGLSDKAEEGTLERAAPGVAGAHANILAGAATAGDAAKEAYLWATLAGPAEHVGEVLKGAGKAFQASRVTAPLADFIARKAGVSAKTAGYVAGKAAGALEGAIHGAGPAATFGILHDLIGNGKVPTPESVAAWGAAGAGLSGILGAAGAPGLSLAKTLAAPGDVAAFTSDPHAILGVAPDASAEEINAAAKQRSTPYHPDVNGEPGAEEIFKTFQQAKNEALRRLPPAAQVDALRRGMVPWEKASPEAIQEYLGSLEGTKAPVAQATDPVSRELSAPLYQPLRPLAQDVPQARQSLAPSTVGSAEPPPATAGDAVAGPPAPLEPAQPVAKAASKPQKPAPLAPVAPPQDAYAGAPAPFHSRLATAISEAPFASAPPQQWLGYLRKAPIAKTEKDWSGIEDTLSQMAPGEKPTREQVLGMAKPAQLTETTLGDYSPVFSVTNENGKWQVRGRDGGKTLEYDSEAEAKAARNNLEGTVNKQPAKFATYTEPGGSNYREILMQLDRPVRRAAQLDRASEPPPGFSIREHPTPTDYTGPLGPYYTWNSPSTSSGMHETRASALGEAWSQYDREKEWGQPDPGDFRTSHFDQPNIVAHLRVNDRPYENPATGKTEKTLFAEELQSDWAQKGRKQGFADPAKEEVRRQRITQRQQEIGSAIDDMLQKAGGASHLTHGQALTALSRNPEYAARFTQLTDESDELNRELTNLPGRVPDMPFKKTEDWVELGLKRLLAEAAAKGYDRVAWTNGSQNADRYDLRKHVSNIDWNPENLSLIARDKNGRLVLNESGVTPDKLADYVGKGPAEKLVSQQPGDGFTAEATDKRSSFPGARVWTIKNSAGHLINDVAAGTAEDAIKKGVGGTRSIAGEDLAVGGEGMTTFYDKIIPNVAKKYLKSLGVDATVEPIEMKFGKEGVDEPDRGISEDAITAFQSHNEEELNGDQHDMLEAWQQEGVPPRDTLMRRWQRQLYDDLHDFAENYILPGPRGEPGRASEVLSIPITPKLRAKILSGQRLFGLAATAGAGAEAASQQKEPAK